MQLTFIGATGTVTGSKYLLRAGRPYLVDCGLFQGYKPLRLRNWAEPPFAPADLAAVLLTHAHIDHAGYLPVLHKRGFRGPVHCSEATYELCKVLLPDSARLQEEEAEYANRKGFSRHAPALPLYTLADAEAALALFRPLPFHAPVPLEGGPRVQLLRAGHILGAAMLRVDDGARSILFSGDLGRPHDATLGPPDAPPDCDALVLESTYGDRCHPAIDPVQELGAVIRRTVDRGGVVVIPAFAVARTQALLVGIAQLKSRGELPSHLPIYLNSPMGADVTDIYRRFRADHRLSEADCTAMHLAARVVSSVDESRWLNTRKSPMVLIAGSGMAAGGRVVHHLKAFASDPRNTVLFTGFQAPGTRGAAMVGGAQSVKIHGQYVAVRAEIANISAWSAHADRAEILDWLRQFRKPPQRIYLTHGEPAAADALRLAIDEQLHWPCSVPDYLETATV